MCRLPFLAFGPFDERRKQINWHGHNGRWCYARSKFPSSSVRTAVHRVPSVRARCTTLSANERSRFEVLLHSHKRSRWIDARVISDKVPVHKLSHLEHRDNLLAIEYRQQLFVCADVALILGILELVFANVLPKLFGQFGPGEWVVSDHCGKRGVGLHGFAKGVFGSGGFLGGRHWAIRTRRAWLPSKKSTVLSAQFTGALVLVVFPVAVLSSSVFSATAPTWGSAIYCV